MRVLDYTIGCQPDSLVALVSRVYKEHPQYAKLRARMVMKALSPMNPFFGHGTCRGFLACSGEEPIAHACAIVDWRLPGVGIIGFFESMLDSEAARLVLKEAVAFLAGSGATSIRAPIDLTTWNGFRVSYPDGEEPFFSEPYTRGYYRGFFAKGGFSIAQHNVSTIHTADQVGFDRFRTNREILETAGYAVKKVERQLIADLLPHVHRLIIDTFSDSWSFVPVSFEEFRYSFLDFAQGSSGVLGHIAYAPGGEPVGFCFGALDWPWNGSRAIIKSVAAVAGERRLEIARALLYSAYEAAQERGASKFILSTMRDDNKRLRALIWGPRRVYRQYEAYELNVVGTTS